ncbi:DUF1801 domain-containing protein [Paucihalobacter sp.]|uniref:DUF1801 domain-containing protein n=1 Tax=Paucihalobacter sp. TaxID=2850405 RepID=UPI002FDF936D
MATLKTQPNNVNVLDFLNSVENEQRQEDCKILLELFTELTNEIPKMWGESIVGFGSYHYKYDSGREGDWFLTGFSPRKQNLTIYIIAGFNEYNDILQKLGKFKTSSSCLYVNKLSDIDIDQLKMLVKKSVDTIKKQYN